MRGGVPPLPRTRIKTIAGGTCVFDDQCDEHHPWSAALVRPCFRIC